MIDRSLVETALPGYEVEGELGRGGYGLVLGGRHRLIGRNVAIKVLLDTTEDAGLRARFLAEARVLAELDHPHIVRIHDYVEHQGSCLLVMELLPGGTLRQRLAVGPMSPEATCALGLATAAALTAAHTHNVLHRDIKPDNMMFAADGLLKVTDFGVAKIFEGTETTASGVLGTPRYMAPEQITGGRLYASTDLYALGGVLYELLAQRPLFGRSLSVGALVNHHLNVTPLPLDGIPNRIGDAIMRTLAKEPAARFPNATDFALELAGAAAAAFGPDWLARSGLKVRLDDEVRHAALGEPSAPGSRGSRMSGPQSHQSGPQGHQSGSGPQQPKPWFAQQPGQAHPQGWSGPQPPHGYPPAPGGQPGLHPNADGWPDSAPAPIAAYQSPPPRQTPEQGPSGWWQSNPYVPGAGQSAPQVGPSGPMGTRVGSPQWSQNPWAPGGAAEGAGRIGPQPVGAPGPLRPRPPGRRSYLPWLLGGVAVAVILALTMTIALVGSGKDNKRPDPVTLHAGTAYAGGALTLPELDAYDVVIDQAGALYITDWKSHRVRKINPDGTVVTVAGTGKSGHRGDGGPANLAELDNPAATVIDPAGNVYITDSGNHRIRRIDTAGVITTVAGTGTSGFSGDGSRAIEAQLDDPAGLAVMDDGTLYVADADNQRIRRISPDGTITTVAGTGDKGYSGDGGPATAAQFDNPIGLAIAADGSLYVADLGNDRVRLIEPDGIITTVAGNGTYGYGGDGGPATEAQLRIPSVSISPDGLLYIADYGNNRVRRVDAGGSIATVAGDGTEGSGGDEGAATAAQLYAPTGAAVDGEGNLYIADDKNDRIRRVSADGVITTVVQAR